MPELCDHGDCKRPATHEGLRSGGRVKACCSHHITSGGVPYHAHGECMNVGALHAKMTVSEFTAAVKAAEASRGFFG